ncbi:VOC family protein [Nostoc punctiforme FACHB-252]|uniref:VOC family protein n=1 Tax=Nostoc punctiforme FACHB-252 TaxID=1357509 RepID=A0ABR8H6G0_NOSPU|nr:VOC family protein [Nostoc punctiforme]MBD2611426.1 VOC family protein [Nostoc punctiforme FACHB-252]
MTFVCTDVFVTIAAVNFENLVNFYTKIFNQKADISIPNVYAEFHLPSMRLGIFQPKDTNKSEFEVISFDSPLSVFAKSKISLCLEVSNLEDAIAHLSALGYPPPGKISIASHGREIYAYDPDGNRLILHEAKESGEMGDKRE